MPENSALPPPNPLRIPAEVHRYELTLSDYWRIILKRRLIVFLTFIGALGVAIIYTNSKTPLYQAVSQVRITSRPRAFSYEKSAYLPSYVNELNTYANTITSEDVMERVVLRLGLLKPDAKAGDLSAKAAEIRGAVSAEAVQDTDVINIVVTYPNPELATAIANQTAQAFVVVDLLQKTRQARNLRRFIESQLEIFAEKLADTENRLRGFRQAGRQMGVASGMDQRLSDLEKEKNLLLKQFTPRHPDVIKLDTQIQDIRGRIKKLPTDELELARLQRELEIHDRAYREMKDRYEQARLAEAEEVSDVTVVENATVPGDPISPQKNLNKMAGAIIGLVLGVLLAFIQENADTSIGTIEDVEKIVRLPVIGIIPYFNPHRENIPWWRFDRHLGGVFKSRRDLPPDSAYLIMNQDTLSSLAEAYRILRTFVEFLMGKREDKLGKIMLVTSTGPQEGKTLTSCNLSIALAQAGRKTLLIDGDLRRPTVHRLFGLKRQPGLSDVLMGTTSLLEARRTMGDILISENAHWDQMLTTKMLDRLEILASGVHTVTPAELLASDSMTRLLEEARIRYDYVIIDTPPVLPVTDARTLGILADAVFFVYRSGKTARRALTRAREELNLAGVKVKGIILNQATPEITLTDQYYYQYYGEKKEPKKSSKPAPAA